MSQQSIGHAVRSLCGEDRGVIYVRAHGTRAKYIYEQCRCGPCSQANTAYSRSSRVRREIVANKDTLRGYLDVEIGRIALGEPVRTHREIADKLGCSRQLIFYRERDVLRKVGEALRIAEEREVAA